MSAADITLMHELKKENKAAQTNQKMEWDQWNVSVFCPDVA